MNKMIFGVSVLASALMTACGGSEQEGDGSTQENESQQEVYQCPESNELEVNFSANSQGSDTSLYEHSGMFDVVATDIVYFHDSTMVLKIDNYEGKREMPDQIQLYISLYTKNGKVLSEGEYPLDPSESMNCGLLIYAGTGMLVVPTHIADGNVSVKSYSKERVCGDLDFSMYDESGFYGEVNVSGAFVVDAQ